MADVKVEERHMEAARSLLAARSLWKEAVEGHTAAEAEMVLLARFAAEWEARGREHDQDSCTACAFEASHPGARVKHRHTGGKHEQRER